MAGLFSTPGHRRALVPSLVLSMMTDFESGTLCQLDDLKLSWSNIYNIKAKGSSYTNDRGGLVRLNQSGRIAVVYHQSSVTVHCLSSGSAVSIDGLIGIKWVDWCPQSHLDNHLTVLCSSGRMFLYRIETCTALLSAVLQCETLVESSEDATLRPVSAAHGHDSVWVLLENGDVLNVACWMPIPSLVEKSLVAESMTSTYAEHGLALVTGVKGTPKTSPPCLVQPEPLEPTGQYKDILLVSYRGVEFLLVSCGQTRIDILLIVDSTILVLLESIELPKPMGPGVELTMRLFPCTSGKPALLAQQGPQVFLVRLTWADQLVDSIIYDVSIDLIKSHVRLVSSGVQSAFPLVIDGALACLTIVKGEQKVVKLQENTISLPTPLEYAKSSSIVDILDKKPVHEPYRPITVDFNRPSLPKEIGGLGLSDLTDQSLLSLLDSAVDPLRGESIASLVAASSALLGILEQIDEAIEKQGKWLAELNERLETHQTKMTEMQEEMGKASTRWSSLQARHQAILERLQSDHIALGDTSELLSRLKALGEQLPVQQLQPTSPKQLTDQDLKQGVPISASIKDLCSRVSRLTT